MIQKYEDSKIFTLKNLFQDLSRDRAELAARRPRAGRPLGPARLRPDRPDLRLGKAGRGHDARHQEARHGHHWVRVCGHRPEVGNIDIIWLGILLAFNESRGQGLSLELDIWYFQRVCDIQQLARQPRVPVTVVTRVITRVSGTAGSRVSTRVTVPGRPPAGGRCQAGEYFAKKWKISVLEEKFGNSVFKNVQEHKNQNCSQIDIYLLRLFHFKAPIILSPPLHSI